MNIFELVNSVLSFMPATNEMQARVTSVRECIPLISSKITPDCGTVILADGVRGIIATITAFFEPQMEEMGSQKSPFSGKSIHDLVYGPGLHMYLYHKHISQLHE